MPACRSSIACPLRRGATLVILVCLLPMAGPAAAQNVDISLPTDQAVQKAVTWLSSVQEGENGGEWPYEGVYRVRGRIPIGYRVGGTGITGLAILLAPGYGEMDERQAAIARATDFICRSIDDDNMAHRFASTYDVRGWGYAYGMEFLLHLEDRDAVPEGRAEQVTNAVQFYLDGIRATEIPENGGWNYARRSGFDESGAPSPFMTGPTIQFLLHARARGYEVNDDMISRGLTALEGGRTPTGSWMYSGDTGRKSRESVPGSVGRMLMSESILFLAGRGSVDRVRAAVDAFIVHWEWLEKRRRKTGTHVAPYGIAPYYFFYAHHAAAQAIEMLPRRERAEYRRHLHRLLFSVQEEDGTWNDRVFDRSAKYGTSMAVLSLLMKDVPTPARFKPAESPE